MAPLRRCPSCGSKYTKQEWQKGNHKCTKIKATAANELSKYRRAVWIMVVVINVIVLLTILIKG